MGFWKVLGSVVGTAAGVKMVQAGSDVMIDRHTEVQVFAINPQLRAHANNLLAQRFRYDVGDPINEFEAALLKLGIYYVNAEHMGDAHMQALFADSIEKIRDAGDGQIRAGVSLEVLGQTGS